MPTSRAFDKRDGFRRQVLAANPVRQHASTLDAQFASFATTIQQRLDTDSGGSQTLSGSLSAQVERAVSQAMRRGNIALAPAGYGGGSGTAYGGRYGTGYGGSSATAYGGGSGNGYRGGYGGGYGVMAGNPGVAQPAGSQAVTAVQLLPVELPPPQAVLASEAVIAQNDLLAALDALQPLSVQPDPGDIAAYKDIIRAEVVTLTAEFARPDLPRPARVRVLFGALLGWAFPAGQPPNVPPVTTGFQTGDVAALLFLLGGLGQPKVPSSFVDQQDALQEVVASAATRLFQLWVEYEFAPGVVPQPPGMWLGVGARPVGVGGSAAVGAPQGLGVGPVAPATVAGTYSQRIIIANELLPVISQDALQVAGALDAIGFSPGQQETTPVNGLKSKVDGDLFFTVPNPKKPNKKIPDTQKVLAAQSGDTGPTVKDLLDWASDLSGAAGLDAIRRCGQLGLNLLADQADELFFIVEAVLQGKKNAIGVPELFDPQVQLYLRSLARDLSELADQGV